MIAVEQGYVEALERLSAPMIHLPFLGVVILFHLADYRLCIVDAHAYPHILLVWQIARDGGEGESRVSYAAAYESIFQDGSLWQLHGVVAVTQQWLQLDLLGCLSLGCWRLEGIGPVVCILGGDVLGECHQRLEILIPVEGILHQKLDILGR